MAIIYAFGDSITYGAWDIEASGWATRLRQYLDEDQLKNPDHYFIMYNLGIPGDTTAGLLKRFDIETHARKREDKGEEIIFIFAFGANDAAFLPKMNCFRVSKEEYIMNLSSVLEKALLITKKILIMNILPVVESKNSTPRNGKIRKNDYMEEYNIVLQKLAERLNIKFVDIYSVFSDKEYYGLFNSDDGLHPNESGHELIFQTIKPELIAMLGLK